MVSMDRLKTQQAMVFLLHLLPSAHSWPGWPPGQCYSATSSITWELVRDAESWSSPRCTESESSFSWTPTSSCTVEFGYGGLMASFRRGCSHDLSTVSFILPPGKTHAGPFQQLGYSQSPLDAPLWSPDPDSYQPPSVRGSTWIFRGGFFPG